MTGHSGVQYDNDRQTAAATKVVETWDAVDGSRNGANALSAAQQSSFWGQETGPVQMRTRATDMFDAISELLTAERDLIQEFEAYMHRAMKEFTGVEYANATAMKKIMSDTVGGFIAKSSALATMQGIYARMGMKVSTADIAKGFLGGATNKTAGGAALGAAVGLSGVRGATTADAQQASSAAQTAAPKPSTY